MHAEDRLHKRVSVEARLGRRKRQYSLYEKKDGDWVRVSELKYTIDVARRVFQNLLLEPYMGNYTGGVRELRPVKEA